LAFPGNENPVPCIFLCEVFLENQLTRRSLLSALSLFPAARLLSGQQGPQPPNYSAEVKVVNLLATVREKSGQIVKGLTKDDFLLEEEDRLQTIRFFEQESGLALNLGLMVDTSGSQARVLDKERSASFKFLDQILRPERDRAFVLHFDFEVELLQDFTASPRTLEKALDLLQVGQPPQQQQTPAQGGGYPQGGSRGRGRGGTGGTKMYDAILLASEDLMNRQKGRKALILLTDGVDTGSRETLYQGISAAQKADTLVYSILFSDPSSYANQGGYGGPGMGRRGRGGRGGMPMPMPRGGEQDLPDGKKVLQQIARETGGRFYEVTYLHSIDKIFADIEEDLRNQYNIGYTPDPPAEPGAYRRIHLTARTARKKDLIVQTRAGYYGS
jgi:VWFA-related protein